ncbi:22516_t:CDS:1, partial [Racocetra persica]
SRILCFSEFNRSTHQPDLAVITTWNSHLLNKLGQSGDWGSRTQQLTLVCFSEGCAIIIKKKKTPHQ